MYGSHFIRRIQIHVLGVKGLRSLETLTKRPFVYSETDYPSGTTLGKILTMRLVVRRVALSALQSTYFGKVSVSIVSTVCTDTFFLGDVNENICNYCE